MRDPAEFDSNELLAVLLNTEEHTTIWVEDPNHTHPNGKWITSSVGSAKVIGGHLHLTLDVKPKDNDTEE